MIVTIVTIRVRPERVDEFLAATIANHEASIREPGNLRFDVLRTKDDPTGFVLYEAYESEAAARAHKETPHYLKWKEQVADWMAQPRVGLPCAVVRPTDPNLW
jgi:autoinducer 2-degrading protein